MDLFADVVAITFIAHFFWSYYWNCYRKGYKIDLWHLSLAVNVFSIHVMLPFSRDRLNALAIGPYMWSHTEAFVNKAYLISALGYAGFLAGGNLWRLRLGAGLRRRFATFMELPARAALTVLSAPRLLIFHCLVSLALIGTTLAIYFAHSGLGFNLRGLLLVMPGLRILAQFSAFYGGLAGSYAFARYSVYRERSMLLMTMAIAVGFLFYGERSTLLSLFLTVGTVTMIRLRRRVRLLYVAGVFVGLLFVVMLLDSLRSSHFSPAGVLQRFGFSIFYGNSFSDTRDFATVLSFWKGEWLLGRTYLAGVMAFIPRFISPYREKWAAGVVTATMAGFSAKEHPGLRVGLFGEAFLNFNLPGVVLLSLFLGSTARLMDLRVKQSLAALPQSGMRAYSYFIIGYTVAAIQNTTTFATFYSIMFFLLFSWLLIRVSRFLKLPLG